MKYEYKTMALATEKSEELVELLDSGYELLAMAPYVMEPKEGKTFVVAYWITLRRPKNG